MVMKIQIDPEIANLCRTLTDAEKAQLEANLKAEGCRDPLVLWGGTLLDGHNRYEICQRIGKAFETVQAPNIKDRGDAINWVIANQLGRRNLNPEEASYLRGKRYNAEKMTLSDAGQNASRASVAARTRSEKPTTLGRTRERLAKELGVNQATISEDGTFAAAIDAIAANVSPEAAREIRTGKAKVGKTAVREIAKRPANEQSAALQKAKRESRVKRTPRPRAAKSTAPRAPDHVTSLQLWLHGGSRHLLAFGSGASAVETCAKYGIQLRADHLADVKKLVDELIEAATPPSNAADAA